MKHEFQIKQYDTRIDLFRAQERIGMREWADRADVQRTQLNRYRSGQATAHVTSLARLVRAASAMCGRKVRASELMDLGESEPIATNREYVGVSDPRRNPYPTRLDTLMYRLGIPADYLSRRAGVSKPTLHAFRAGTSSPYITTLGRLVRTFRQMGYPVTASDIVDVGED